MAENYEATWPIKPITYGTWEWLRREVCGYLDFGFDYATLNHLQKGKVLSVIQSGMQQYYFPPPMEGQNGPHTWSFLTPVRQLFLKDGRETTDLPADFTGVIGDMTYQSGQDRKIVPIVPELQLRQRAATDARSGFPEYVAIRPVHVPTLRKVYYEALLYPTPDASADGLSLDYRSQVVPTSITEESDYSIPIFAGPNHVELVLASCLAVAEQRYKGGPGTYSGKYLGDLKAAIQVDLASLKPTEEAMWPAAAIDYGTVAWLRREIGGYLKFGFDHKAWNPTQVGRVISIIQSGSMQFYFPPPVVVGEEKESKPPHQWSFLTPVRTITMAAADYDYGLPADFTGIIGDLTWQSGTTSQIIPIVAESKIRQLRASNPLSGQPKYAAIRPVSVTGVKVTHELLLYPTPSSDEAGTLLEYRSQVVPEPISADSDFDLQLYGSQQHAEVILASCLAIAEHRESGGPGSWAAKYQQQLQAAMQNDILVMQPTEDAIWPVELLANGLRINKAYLKRMIGRQLKFGPHPGAWNHKQSTEVQLVLERGLRQFYDPVIVNSAYSHEWSFLRPLYELTTVADQYKYDLPTDFVMLYGPVMFAPGASTLLENIEEIPLYRVRQQLQLDGSARPRVCGINSRVTDNAIGGVTWELWLAPAPDDEYTLVLPYKANPLTMSDEASLPYGGQEHHETLIEACLSAAEAHQEKKGMHHERFLTMLAASISRDQKQSSPDTIGYNRDPSDKPGYWPWFRNHGADGQTVTYNGDVIEAS